MTPEYQSASTSSRTPTLVGRGMISAAAHPFSFAVACTDGMAADQSRVPLPQFGSSCRFLPSTLAWVTLKPKEIGSVRFGFGELRYVQR